jgi:hypothetical protein
LETKRDEEGFEEGRCPLYRQEEDAINIGYY